MFCLLNISCQLRLTNKLPDLLVNILPSMWLLIPHSFCEALVTGKQAEINRGAFLPASWHRCLNSLCLHVHPKQWSLKICREETIRSSWISSNRTTLCWQLVSLLLWPFSILLHNAGGCSIILPPARGPVHSDSDFPVRSRSNASTSTMRCPWCCPAQHNLSVCRGVPSPLSYAAFVDMTLVKFMRADTGSLCPWGSYVVSAQYIDTILILQDPAPLLS